MLHIRFLSFNFKTPSFFRPIYQGNFGGVSVISKENYVLANGFSNVYFGWGAEGK